MSDMSGLRRAIETYDQSYPPGLYAPVPPLRITAIAPPTIGASGPATTFTVTGAGFTATSVIEVDQVARTTTFVDETTLTFTGNPTGAGQHQITVQDGGVESAAFPYTVTALARAETQTATPKRRNGKTEATAMQPTTPDQFDDQPEPRPAPESEPVIPNPDESDDEPRPAPGPAGDES